jgi:hypothetical protein
VISLLTQTRLFRIRFCSVRVPSCHWPFQLGVGRGGGGGGGGGGGDTFGSWVGNITC